MGHEQAQRSRAVGKSARRYQCDWTESQLCASPTRHARVDRLADCRLLFDDSVCRAFVFEKYLSGIGECIVMRDG